MKRDKSARCDCGGKAIRIEGKKYFCTKCRQIVEVGKKPKKDS